MRDLLLRLRNAMPRVTGWIEDLHANNAGRCTNVADLGFPRLAQYLPAPLLNSARTVTTDSVPFPPVMDYGLPEFQQMAQMPMSGITFGSMYFVRRADNHMEEVHFHELIHVIQWAKLGFNQFLLTYALGIIQFGYERSPLEAAAYDFQARFQQRQPLRDIVQTVGEHALQSRDAAQEVFRQYGIEMPA